MRQALRANVKRAAVSVTRSVPAPTGGWDTESPLAKMPAKNAVILDDWIPRASRVELRRGFIQQVTGTASPVESMIAWRGDAAGDKLFACAGAEIFDVTDQGALGSAVYASALNARWKSANFSNDGGAWAIAANGAQAPIGYEGSGWGALAITGQSGVIVLDPAKLADPMAHKRRLWFIERDTLRVWFLQTNAIQGPASLLDLGPLAYKGGRLAAQGTWSLDNGQGMDDVAVFLTTEGQVIVYQGIDPSSADNWTLVGVFDLAKPVGDRPLFKWGADLVVMTADGVMPLSQALSRDREEAKKIALTQQIASAFATAAENYGSNYGWGGVLYSGRGSLAIFNVPTSELESAQQFVQSIQTGAWCRFTGIPAICWEVANGAAYFGSVDGVYRWDVGSSDDGEVVSGNVKPAFSDFGAPVRQKKFTMIQALLKAPSIVKPALEILVDYAERQPTAVPTVIGPADISTEDDAVIRSDWTAATGVGTVGAPRMALSVVGDDEVSRLSYDGTDLILIETGGDHVLISPNLPTDVSVELIGFNVVFQTGNVL